LDTTFDLEELERVIERAIEKARSDELRLIAEAVKTLADYMKTGFKETIERIEVIEKRIETIEKRLEEHAIILQEHTKRLEELSRIVSRLEVALGSTGRW
jgi:methyl-accepting chemotaxis protein